MKTKILLLCLMLTLTSCSSDDNPIQINDPENLDGSWTIVNIFGGLAGIDDDYEPGQIIWSFDEENETLTVDNSVEDEDVITSGLPSGTYDYYIETEEGTNYLFVDDYNFAHFSISADTLLIDQGVASDGFLFTLKSYGAGN